MWSQNHDGHRNLHGGSYGAVVSNVKCSIFNYVVHLCMSIMMMLRFFRIGWVVVAWKPHEVGVGAVVLLVAWLF